MDKKRRACKCTCGISHLCFSLTMIVATGRASEDTANRLHCSAYLNVPHVPQALRDAPPYLHKAAFDSVISVEERKEEKSWKAPAAFSFRVRGCGRAQLKQLPLLLPSGRAQPATAQGTAEKSRSVQAASDHFVLNRWIFPGKITARTEHVTFKETSAGLRDKL